MITTIRNKTRKEVHPSIPELEIKKLCLRQSCMRWHWALEAGKLNPLQSKGSKVQRESCKGGKGTLLTAAVDSIYFPSPFLTF